MKLATALAERLDAFDMRFVPFLSQEAQVRFPSMTIAIATALLLCSGFAVAQEVHPPLSVSCGFQLPVTWEQGAAFEFLDNGQVALVTPDMPSQGVSMMVGRWSRDGGGYLIAWRGVVMRDGRFHPSTKKQRLGRFLMSSLGRSGERTLEMRGDKVLQCLLGD